MDIESVRKKKFLRICIVGQMSEHSNIYQEQLVNILCFILISIFINDLDVRMRSTF